MTESYDPYQNAVAERINGILKQEFLFNTMSIDLNSIKALKVLRFIIMTDHIALIIC